MRVEFIYEPPQQGSATDLVLERHTTQEAQVRLAACTCLSLLRRAMQPTHGLPASKQSTAVHTTHTCTCIQTHTHTLCASGDLQPYTLCRSALLSKPSLIWPMGPVLVFLTVQCDFIASVLGLSKVGWVFSQAAKDTPEDYIMSSSEVGRQALGVTGPATNTSAVGQAVYSDPCTFCACKLTADRCYTQTTPA